MFKELHPIFKKYAGTDRADRARTGLFALLVAERGRGRPRSQAKYGATITTPGAISELAVIILNPCPLCKWVHSHVAGTA